LLGDIPVGQYSFSSTGNVFVKKALEYYQKPPDIEYAEPDYSDHALLVVLRPNPNFALDI
jgi:hypothetical protein